MSNTFRSHYLLQLDFTYKKVDINSHEMKELFLVFSLLTIILTASAVNGQSFNTETNNTEQNLSQEHLRIVMRVFTVE